MNSNALWIDDDQLYNWVLSIRNRNLNNNCIVTSKTVFHTRRQSIYPVNNVIVDEEWQQHYTVINQYQNLQVAYQEMRVKVHKVSIKPLFWKKKVDFFERFFDEIFVERVYL